MRKVSVIVPVYNVEKYLEKCLDSLMRQTLEDLEVIVVNDGSRDGSQQIIDRFTAEFPDRIRAFSKENGGLSDARNFGLKHTDAEFIGFVDSDDYVTPTMFAEMYSLAQKHGAEMVVCNLQKVDQHGSVTQKLTQIPNLPERIDVKSNFSVFSDLSYFACNKIFKKELFEGKNFKSGAHFEDIQLIPQLLLQCNTLAHTQNYHYQYLERADSITRTHTEKGLDMLSAVEDVEVAFRTSGYKDEEAGLKNFQILEGVYSFLAYLAFVRDEKEYRRMSAELKKFIQSRGITRKEIIQYQRFGKNYLVSLPAKKQIYYLLYFFGMEGIIRKLL